MNLAPTLAPNRHCPRKEGGGFGLSLFRSACRPSVFWPPRTRPPAKACLRDNDRRLLLLLLRLRLLGVDVALAVTRQLFRARACPIVNACPGLPLSHKALIQPRCLHLGFRYVRQFQGAALAGGPLVRPQQPLIRFLFVKPQLRSTLPPDPASRRRPCASLPFTTIRLIEDFHLTSC